jgi:hypothetical protein
MPLYAKAEGHSLRTESGNIYSAGPSIGLTENAAHDVIAAGGNIVISGNVGNDVLAAGGSLLISGKTGGDVRVAGGSVSLDNEIGGEAILAGGRIHVLPRTVITYDLIAAAGDIEIAGMVSGGARIIGETVIINGTIGKDVDIKAQQVTIGKNAVVKGELRYSAPREARVEQGAVITGVTKFTRMKFERPRETVMKVVQAFWFAKLIAIISAAVVLYLAFTEKTKELTALALNRFGSEMLTGFVVLVTVPFLILLLFMTVAGSFLGLFGVFLYVAVLLLSSVLGALVFTRLISGYLFKKEPSFTWPIVLLGVLLYQVLGLLPFLGWILKFIFFLSALGALSQYLSRSLKEKPSPVQP